MPVLSGASNPRFMCGKAFKCLFDSGLLLLLAVQTFLLLTLTYRGYWEIPTWVVENVFEKQAPSELSLELDSIRWYPKKGIEVQGIHLKSTTCVCPILYVERILMVPMKSLLESANFSKGIVENISLYFPDPYLPQSENLPLVHEGVLRFELSKDELLLKSLKGKISNLVITTLNPLRLDLSALRGVERQEPSSFSSEMIFKKLKEIKFIHDYFENAEDALLTVTFRNEQLEKSAAELNLYAASSLMSGSVATKGIYLSGTLRWDGNLQVEDSLDGEIQMVRFGDQVQLHNVDFEFLYNSGSEPSLVPDKIQLHSASFSVLDRSFDFLSATVDPIDLTTGTIKPSLGFGNQFVSSEISYDLDEKTATVSLVGDLNPVQLAQHWAGPIEGMDSRLRFDQVPHLTASFLVHNWKEISDISFRVVTEEVFVKDVGFLYARARGHWDHPSRSAELTHFVAEQSHYSIRGKMFKSIETTEYRYLIDGTGIPSDLNPMFKPWWANTWQHFDFKNHPVRFDIDIWGVENDKSQRHVYGAMGFDDISYKGLQIDLGQVRLNAISKYVELFDLYIQQDGAVASGSVQNVFESTGSRQVSQHLDLYTNIPFHHLAPAVGDYLDPFVENTRPNTVADVWVKGVMVKEEFPQFKYLDDLNIKIHVDRPTEFFGFEIDEMDAVIEKQGDTFTGDPVRFKFAEGEGRAHFSATGPDDDKKLDFSIAINDLDFRKAIPKIAAFNEEKEDLTLEKGIDATVNERGVPAAKPVVVSEKKKEKKGIQLTKHRDNSFMDLVIEGSCPVGDLDGMQARGSFELDDPLIHRVHVFGGFSKLMDNAELNLGSFSLKRATSPFLVDGRILRLEDLELTGPSSRVKSKGSINMENGSLDFRLKAYPLREVKFPVVAGLALVLRPFAHMFEVQLTGTFEDPDWKVVIDPSGL